MKVKFTNKRSNKDLTLERVNIEWTASRLKYPIEVIIVDGPELPKDPETPRGEPSSVALEVPKVDGRDSYGCYIYIDYRVVEIADIDDIYDDFLDEFYD